MDKASYFVHNKAIFGSFPSQDDVDILESIGVVLFVDLTHPFENTVSYQPRNARIIRFPIPDLSIPEDRLAFSKLVMQLSHEIETLANGKKIYVHCRGGHGRSGVVVACILAYYLDLDPLVALRLTREYHSRRKTMRERWRRLGAPQTDAQKQCVVKMCGTTITDVTISDLELRNTGLCKLYDATGNRLYFLEAYREYVAFLE